MKAMMILSAVMGLFFGGVGFVVLLILGIHDAFYISVMGGSLFAAALFVFLVAYEKWMDNRYAKVEREIAESVFCKANGNFAMENGNVRNGNIYFCETGIICAFMEEKPYERTEIPLTEINAFETDRDNLRIILTDGKVIRVMIPVVQDVVSVLQEKGWMD